MTEQLTRTNIEDASRVEKFHEQYIKEGKYLKNLWASGWPGVTILAFAQVVS
jgi:hypothetical protein